MAMGEMRCTPLLVAARRRWETHPVGGTGTAGLAGRPMFRPFAEGVRVPVSARKGDLPASSVAAEAGRLCVVSADSHVGPSMQSLRPYCERRYLDDFDAFAGTVETAQALASQPSSGPGMGEVPDHAIKSGWPSDW